MSSVPPRQKESRPQSWDIVQVAPWTDAGAIDESHVIAGKRQLNFRSHLINFSIWKSNTGCCV